MISEFTVPWVAAESSYGHELAMEWIKSDKENIASAGWATYSNLLALTPDDKLNKKEIVLRFKKSGKGNTQGSKQS